MMPENVQELHDHPGLIPRQVLPENLESPINNLTEFLTPNDFFYVRTHLGYPSIDMETWALAFDGEVEQPLTLRLEDLRAMPQVSKVVTIECSGNKRGLMEPPPPGEQWQIGAVGTAKWSGVPLTYLLDQLGYKDNVAEFVFSGSDAGVRPDMTGQVNFVRSLPADKALLAECILALDMNDQPLPFKHGFPVRLIVPGWYGMAHVKWLSRITASATPFKGPFQAVDYMYITNPDDYRDATPVREIRVNSIITWPSKGEIIHAGTHSLRGLAWTGTGTIAKVEVSTDNGLTWFPAQLTSPEHTVYTWTFWEYTWQVNTPGHYFILVRAQDSQGNIQPKVAPWNAKGYGNNSAHRVEITVPRPPNITLH